MVTPLGCGTVTVTALAGLGLAMVGWIELLVFLLAGLTLMVTGLIMSMGSLNYRAELDLDKTHLSVGQESELSITLSNQGKRATRAGRIGLLVGSEPFHLALPALSPGHVDHLHLRLQALHRGTIFVGPVTMEAGDPFGAILRKRILTDGDQLYVHPRTVDLTPITAGLQRDLEGQIASGTVDDDLEFHALRQYEPGDDIKRIHWLSTAKTGSLMVRQYEPTLRTDTALWIDADPSSYSSDEEFELAVSIFASLGVRCLLDGRRLVAMVPGDQTGNRPGGHSGIRPGSPHQGRPAPEIDILRTDSPRAFLDDCSSILPIATSAEEGPDPTSASWPDMMETQAPDASLILLISGSLADQQTTQAMTSGFPKAIQTMVLNAAKGEERTIQGQGELARARLATLEDLPLIMEALI